MFTCNRVDAELAVKIGDFGRSRDLEDDYDYVSQDKKAKLPVKWMAPESLDRRLYNEKSDVVWKFFFFFEFFFVPFLLLLVSSTFIKSTSWYVAVKKCSVILQKLAEDKISYL